MDFLVAAALDCLVARQVEFERGLVAVEFRQLEETFGFTFAPEQRRLLAAAVPVGEGWINWRDHEEVLERLDRPIRHMVFAVLHRGFWPPSWGKRPPGERRAETAARHRLREVPRLVPFHGHYYLPAAPAPCGSPVFSVLRTGVSSHGDTLLDHVEHQFGRQRRIGLSRNLVPQITFWSDLAAGVLAQAR
jgi:hypothetical protein